MRILYLLVVASVRLAESKIRLCAHDVDPQNHPNQKRTHTSPPVISSPLFMGYRGGISKDALDRYNETNLGTAVWPQYPVLASIDDSIKELESRPWLWLVDISNYVPGDTDDCDPEPSFGVCEYHLSQEKYDLLVKALGHRFMGMDNGEQDGRYMSYVSQHPRQSRVESYLYLREHFERLESDLKFRMMSLNSLYYPHYFAISGYYTAVGAETAQGLPNDQIFYAFLRGASKQYGTLIFGDASIGNRWWGPEGPKSCPFDSNTQSCVCSENGTSLSLLRRLMIQQTQYGSSLLSFEGGLTCQASNGSTLISPIGAIQQAVQNYVKENVVGTHIVNTAIMLDFFQGFAPPRHLYSSSLYRSWGNHVWDEGDFASHGVLNMIYPDYERASYFHNESGFLTGTPFNDATDVLLSDTPLWLLNRYSIVILFSGVRDMKEELRYKLEAYVNQGGTLVVNSRTLRDMVIFGVGGNNLVTDVTISKGTKIETKTASIVESVPVRFAQNIPGLPNDAFVVAKTSQHHNLAYSLSRGHGTMLVFSSSGVSSENQVTGTIESNIDTPLPNPFPLASHVTYLLSEQLRDQRIVYFENQDDDISVITNRVKEFEYVVAVSNNNLNEKSLDIKSIKSSIGSVKSVDEIVLSDAHLFSGTSLCPGYVPTHTPKDVNIGKSTMTSIAGLDQRLFRVVLNDENNADWISDTIDPVPNRTTHIGLSPSSSFSSIMRFLRLRPTFTQHFDTIILDWSYVERTTAAVLEYEGQFLQRQNINAVIDFTSGANLYPDLRFCNNSLTEFNTSLNRVRDVMSKANDNLGINTSFIFSLHRTPENGYSQCDQDFLYVLRNISSKSNVVYLRVGQDDISVRPPSTWDAALTLSKQVPNLRLAVNTAWFTSQKNMSQVNNVHAWFVSASSKDPFDGSVLTWRDSLRNIDDDELNATKAILTSSSSNVPIFLDFSVRQDDWDEEWSEIKALWDILA